MKLVTLAPAITGPVLATAKSSSLGWGERELLFLARGKSHLGLPMFVDKEDPAYVCIWDSIRRSLDPQEREDGRRKSG